MSSYPIPIKRRRRQAEFWFITAVVLLAVFTVFCALLLASDIGDMMEIQEDKLLTPEVTPVPEAEPTPPPAPLPKAWVRYDVDLDDELQQYIDDVCAEYGVEAAVVMAIIETESGCDPSLVGDAGHSWGLMQIYSTQHTARCVRLGAWNLLDPRMNVRVGVDYLAELLDCGHGMEWALSWYNGHGGEPCDYAYTVITRAEQLLESAMTVTE